MIADWLSLIGRHLIGQWHSHQPSNFTLAPVKPCVSCCVDLSNLYNPLLCLTKDTFPCLCRHYHVGIDTVSQDHSCGRKRNFVHCGWAFVLFMSLICYQGCFICTPVNFECLRTQFMEGLLYLLFICQPSIKKSVLYYHFYSVTLFLKTQLFFFWTLLEPVWKVLL